MPPTIHVRRSRSLALLHTSAKQDRPRSIHACRLDDPLTWAVIPARMYLHSHMTRWTLGPSDIMFTNPYGRPLSFLVVRSPLPQRIFHILQEGRDVPWQAYTSPQSTPRSKAAHRRVGASFLKYPPSHRRLYFAELVDKIHLFAEGKASTSVCQKAATPWKYLPRRCARLSVTFGAPVSLAAVHGAMTRSDVVPGEAAEAQEEERRREDGERVVEALGRQASRIYTTAKEDIKGASYTLNS
ncbi:hypothetical protein EDB85DRAFT_2143034 [Lactarius pseudohatsudake]|nr:hypothetical protein EDB85DRAFT_2143034 [Lactarius pseudohatsudake]